MPLSIIRNDITKMKCDAIVNAANETLLGGGGVDGAIHKAAGPKLLEACRKIGGCPTGEARITKGYDLPARYVIHTVGPVWRGGDHGEEDLLRSCYRNSLALADQYHLKSIAFPLISSGAYGYPGPQALSVATSEIARFLEDHEMNIYMVVFDKTSFHAGSQLFQEIKTYINDKYVYEHSDSLQERRRRQAAAMYDTGALPNLAPTMALAKESSLKDLLNARDESFAEMLLRLIDERGLKDSECYKKANIDRKLFSKIRSNKLYKPSKVTAVAFCIALELDMEEASALLYKAGFALSESLTFDIIIEYCIRHRRYNIYEINQVLFEYDQPTLGNSIA